MFPNADIPELSAHIFGEDKVPLLKMGALYGNNASGKSNFVKALSFIRAFALSSPSCVRGDIWTHLYRLDEVESIEQSSFRILVEFRGSRSEYYVYEIELDLSGVKLEQLSCSGLSDGVPQAIYTRKYSTVEISPNLSRTTQEQWKHTKSIVEKGLEQGGYRSLLSLLLEFPVLEEQSIVDAYHWFRNNLVVVSGRRVYNDLNALLYRSRELSNFANLIIKGTNIGIDDLRVESTDLPSWISKHADIAHRIDFTKEVSAQEVHAFVRDPDRPVFNRINEAGEERILELKFSHKTAVGKEYSLGVEDESDGTIRALHLIPSLYYALSTPSTVIIDEIDSSLHPNLLLDLVAFFSFKKTEGQLLFTTHDTNLLDSRGIMRADEVWFVDRRDDHSYLYSLDNFTHEMRGSVSRRYREGRYGANYIGYLGQLGYES